MIMKLKGKKRKEPLTTLETLNSFKSKKIYIALNTENMLVRVKGNRTDSLNIIFKAKCICYDIYSPELIGVDNIENYIYKSIDLQSLLETANNKFPSQVKSYFKSIKYQITILRNLLLIIYIKINLKV